MKKSTMIMKHDSTKNDMQHDKMDQCKMAKTYVCSMHPEATSDKPGECPKCGMALIEKKMDMKKENKSSNNKTKSCC